MRELAERGWFLLCLGFGRLLRAATYSTVRLVMTDGEPGVRKHRGRHAPLLVGASGPLVRALDTGVRVLPQREWEERERRMYATLHGMTVRVDGDGALILPHLEGRTLATLLEDPAVEDPLRGQAIELAVVALRELHRSGFTHGDAMAENVMIDLERGVARWFDFETVHDSTRSEEWRRADDLRALLATCLLRAAPDARAATLHVILDRYDDDDLTPRLAASFGSPLRRPLAFHLGQAPLSFRGYREVGRLLRERIGA